MRDCLRPAYSHCHVVSLISSLQKGGYEGYTSLMLAAKLGHEELVRAIIDAGARISLLNAVRDD
jgi:hypothetical protein